MQGKSLLSIAILLIIQFTLNAQFAVYNNSVELPKVAVLPTCDNANSGRLTYNTTTGKVYYCDGTGWKEVGPLALPYSNTGNTSTSLFSITNSTGTGTAIVGIAPNGIGVWGNSSNNIGVYGLSASGWAGYFSGFNGLYTTGTNYALQISGKLILQGGSPSVGSLVSANSSGNTVWMPNVAFSVKDVGASSQSIPHNADTRVNFDTEEYDLGNDFDLTTNVFTAPVSGIYSFSAGIMWDGPTNSTGILAITLRINNTNYFTMRSPSAAGQTPSNVLTTDLKLTAGQTVSLFAFQNSGVAQNINSNSITSRFTGRLVTLQ